MWGALRVPQDYFRQALPLQEAPALLPATPRKGVVFSCPWGGGDHAGGEGGGMGCRRGTAHCPLALS